MTHIACPHTLLQLLLLGMGPVKQSVVVCCLVFTGKLILQPKYAHIEANSTSFTTWMRQFLGCHNTLSEMVTVIS